MRPRARDAALRQRVAVLAGALTMGVIATVAVPALGSERQDDLEHRKAGVIDSLQSANSDLSEVSADLVSATNALSTAQTRLVSAQRELARTRGQLAVAESLDDQMADELAQAQAELVDAIAAVEETEADIEVRRARIGDMVADTSQYGSPELASLGSVLGGSDPAEIGANLALTSSVMNSQTSELDELSATETVLGVQQELIQELRDEVALKRAAAAQNLEVKAELTRSAQAQTAAVAEIVASRRTAQQDAAAERQVELDRIAVLEARRQQVETMLQAVARRQAARRLAAAQAAAAERAAAERAAAARHESTPTVSASVQPSSSPLSLPVDSSYVTSPYGMRLHPILSVYKLHDGTDFGAGCGTPIYAAASGTVVSALNDAAYGNRVIMTHGIIGGRSLATSYNHLTSDTVSTGQRVSKGQVIGYAGTTGYSTGCHLHFMVYENGSTVDPMGWLG
ncbi:MAG: peptidoglycan DD-metalloendopeptidase family protein [Nocardioidaceae bacterium]|nr:peptidoglycan DD-metalloendopeptidase family protein [Nocardioidaceae bacterium]